MNNFTLDDPAFKRLAKLISTRPEYGAIELKIEFTAGKVSRFVESRSEGVKPDTKAAGHD